MFINPTFAIEQGWIRGITDPDKQVQPNAIDFTLDRAFEMNDNGRGFLISESTKTMIGSTEIDVEKTVYFIIKPSSMLDGLSDVYVDLPEGVCAQLVIRSTLARNGLILTSGLYDSGFKGHIGFLLHNRAPTPAYIAPGTRVGQIIFIRSESAKLYEGGYNHEQGTELGYQNAG